MKLEVGKFYRTAEGLTVGPMNVDHTESMYPFEGRDAENTIYSFTAEGSYYLSTSSHYDLVEEVPDPRAFGPETAPGARPTKQTTLEAAIAAVADRGLNYGTPEDNFQRIARLWSAHLVNRYADGRGGDTTVMTPTLDAHDVAMMMTLMKIARLENQPVHDDSWIDIAGYAACGNNLPPP